MTYYIECLPINYVPGTKPEIIDLTGKEAKQVLTDYMVLFMSKKYGHLALRHFNGWLHELISECFLNDETPFWYTNYPAYKNFREEIQK